MTRRALGGGVTAEEEADRNRSCPGADTGGRWEEGEDKHRVIWKDSYNVRIVERMELDETSRLLSACIVPSDPHHYPSNGQGSSGQASVSHFINEIPERNVLGCLAGSGSRG